MNNKRILHTNIIWGVSISLLIVFAGVFYFIRSNNHLTDNHFNSYGLPSTSVTNRMPDINKQSRTASKLNGTGIHSNLSKHHRINTKDENTLPVEAHMTHQEASVSTQKDRPINKDQSTSTQISNDLYTETQVVKSKIKEEYISFSYQKIDMQPLQSKHKDVNQEESKWRELIRRPLKKSYMSKYPFASCFLEIAQKYNVPLHILLGMAAYYSNFDPSSTMDNKYGIMHIGWPYPAIDLGENKKENLMNTPCKNIEHAGKFFSSILEKSKGSWLLTMVLYDHQSDDFENQRITKNDLFFSKKIRQCIEQIIREPFQPQTMVPFLSFDHLSTARDFMESIENRSQIHLWIRQKGLKYMVCIPVTDQNEIAEKAGIIKNETGIKVNFGG